MSKTPLTQDELSSIRGLRELAATGTHYALLGLATSASHAEIDAAWQGYARKWHPDRFYSRDAGDLVTVLEDTFAAAFKAFRALSDPTKRVAYDRELAAAGKLFDSGTGVSSGGGGGHPLRNASPGARSTAPVTPGVPAPPPRAAMPAAVQRAQAGALERVQRARASIAEARQDMKDGKWSKAESCLKMALTFDPGNPDASALLQEVSAHAGVQRARIWLAQARAEEEIGRQREALVLYKRAAEHELPDAEGYVRLGKLLLLLDNDERAAVSAFRKAALKAPRQVDVHLLLADAYERVGLESSARREAEIALSLDSRNETAKAILKRVR
jgi:curved DNA-binding protein CbpA